MIARRPLRCSAAPLLWLMLAATAACTRAPAPPVQPEEPPQSQTAAAIPETPVQPAPPAGTIGPPELPAVGDPARETPPESLREAGLVVSEQAESRISALLGAEDYAALMATTALSTTTDTPGLVTFNVRGLNTVMESALQQQRDTIRVGLIRGDEVRWYSNDPATRAQPPAWFHAWRDRFADKPVRLMSVPGTPLLPAGANGG